jgi:hypothetical protein
VVKQQMQWLRGYGRCEKFVSKQFFISVCNCLLQVHRKGGLPLDLAGGQVQFLKKELAYRLDKPEIRMELSELSSPLFVHRYD